MLISCHECGHDVSTEARSCINCGAPPRKRKSNTRQLTPPENIKLVKPYNALYHVRCESCGNALKIDDACLSAGCVTCPFDGVQINLREEGRHIEMVPGVGVLYKRFGDLFSCEGRVGVGGYWLIILILLPLFYVGLLIHPFSFPLLSMIFLPPLWVKRLHDHGLIGGWLMLPFVAILILILITVNQSGETASILEFLLRGASMLVIVVVGALVAFCPGNKKINRYGPPPSQMVIRW